MDSRTTVQTVTQEVLTAGFGMGPGRHLRYGRVQLLFEFESTFLLNRGPHSCGCGKKEDARAISAAGLHTSDESLVLTPAVYQTDLLSEL